MNEILLANALVWTGAAHAHAGVRRYEAIAIRADRVVGVGGISELRSRFPSASEVDLGGRAVVPGLIDGHCHAVRGAATWIRDIHWGSLREPSDAIRSLVDADDRAVAGAWLTVVGGWHSSQFGGWTPSKSDLNSVSATRPVFVQSLYEIAFVNDAALEALGGAALAALPAGAVERDAAGVPTGRVFGMPAFTAFLIAAGTPDLEVQADGIRALSRDFAARGLTGVMDPGGFGMDEPQYAALRGLAESLDLRFRLYLSATTAGDELRQVDEWLPLLDALSPNSLLRACGIGEIAHLGAHDMDGYEERDFPYNTTSEFLEISRRVAARGASMHVHSAADATARMILDQWEAVDAITPIAPLRFSLAHGDRLSRDSQRRMSALGVGLVVDGSQAVRADASSSVWGNSAMLSVPPLASLDAQRIHLGIGTDGTRAALTDIWLALWWLVEGRSLSGERRRSSDNVLSRERALRAATSGNAWLTGEENERGVLREGMLADLAVLDRDYFRVAPEEIPSIGSDLTLLGGRAVHSSPAFAGFQSAQTTSAAMPPRAARQERNDR